jgi:serine/threonine-protein kinase
MQPCTSLEGARIGKYHLLAHVATGGMGAVYKAKDEHLGRIVALKLLSQDLSSNPALVERFKREARHAAKLSHKNIVTLYDYDTVDGYHYITMEFIDGIDLSEYIRRKGQIDHEEARRILIQACKALEHAFAQGITHRDIKPSNFLLANEEGRCRVKLTDLGLARTVDDEEFRVTRAGATVGTVDYMSPEQARDSAAADIRSDIYSLGCTFYHMLAGRAPFAEGGIGERVYKHMAADPPDIRQFNTAVPMSLWTVIRRMLAKHPDDRFQNPSEVIEALRSVMDPVSQQVRQDQEESGILGKIGRANADARMPTTPMPRTPPPKTPSLPNPQSKPPSDAESKAKRPSGPQKKEPSSDPRTKKQTVPDLGTVSDDPPDSLGVTREQRNAANGQFVHATEILRTGAGDGEYVTKLLLSSCKLDPTNVMYRKMLREHSRERASKKKAGWFSSLGNMPARARIKATLRAKEFRKVLDDGEEFLAHTPNDVQVQLDMVEAAKALTLSSLELWMLEEAKQYAPNEKAVLRALALVYEELKRYKHAIALWERLRELFPDDDENATKIRELSVAQTLAKGNYRG